MGDENIDALVYIATNSKFGKPRKNYLETIVDGIVSFKADVNWIDEVQSWKGNIL